MTFDLNQKIPEDSAEPSISVEEVLISDNVVVFAKIKSTMACQEFSVVVEKAVFVVHLHFLR